MICLMLSCICCCDMWSFLFSSNTLYFIILIKTYLRIFQRISLCTQFRVNSQSHFWRISIFIQFIWIKYLFFPALRSYVFSGLFGMRVPTFGDDKLYFLIFRLFWFWVNSKALRSGVFGIRLIIMRGGKATSNLLSWFFFLLKYHMIVRSIRA